jgi:hypothetical protein
LPMFISVVQFGTAFADLKLKEKHGGEAAD